MLSQRLLARAARPLSLTRPRAQSSLASPAGPSSPLPSSSSSASPLSSSPLAAPGPSAPSPSAAPLETRYHVARTAGGALPVYSDVRNGGNHWRTIVRRVSALQADLNLFLSEAHIDPISPPPRATLRPTNGHLEVRGRLVDELKAFLAARGF